MQHAGLGFGIAELALGADVDAVARVAQRVAVAADPAARVAVPRQVPEVRRVVTRQIKEMIDGIARLSPDWGQPGAHEQALVTVATMVGTLLLARAVDDTKLSDALLKAALKQLAAAGT